MQTSLTEVWKYDRDSSCTKLLVLPQGTLTIVALLLSPPYRGVATVPISWLGTGRRMGGNPVGQKQDTFPHRKSYNGYSHSSASFHQPVLHQNHEWQHWGNWGRIKQLSYPRSVAELTTMLISLPLGQALSCFLTVAPGMLFWRHSFTVRCALFLLWNK